MRRTFTPLRRAWLSTAKTPHAILGVAQGASAEDLKQAYRKKAQTDTLFGDQAPRERRFFKEDGTPIQMNTAKWPFSIDEDGLHVYVHVALPKFLDSAQVDADVQPTYVRVTSKKWSGQDEKILATLQLVLPCEVLTDSSNAKRSATTGHLLLTCPILV